MGIFPHFSGLKDISDNPKFSLFFSGSRIHPAELSVFRTTETRGSPHALCGARTCNRVAFEDARKSSSLKSLSLSNAVARVCSSTMNHVSFPVDSSPFVGRRQ